MEYLAWWISITNLYTIYKTNPATFIQAYDKKTTEYKQYVFLSHCFSK
jgi:hypothetical protein